MTTPQRTRTPSSASISSIPGTPSWIGNGDEVNTKLQHLATQVVTNTVSSRAQLKALGEEFGQLARGQEEVLGLMRAQEARRQNRIRSLAGQELVPVLRDSTPSLPAIKSLASLDSMSTSDLAAWYAYYTSSSSSSSKALTSTKIPREDLIAALSAEVGLPPPPSYAQATLLAPSKPSPSSFMLSPAAMKWAAILTVLAGTIALSIHNSDNASLQNLLQQIIQIVGQYVLKTTLAVRSASIQMLASVEEFGTKALAATGDGGLHALRVGRERVGSGVESSKPLSWARS